MPPDGPFVWSILAPESQPYLYLRPGGLQAAGAAPAQVQVWVVGIFCAR